MSAEVTRRVIEGFLGDLGGHWLAHDVEVIDVVAGSRCVGRTAATTVLRAALRTARQPELLIVSERGAVEWTSPTPMAAIAEVRSGEIVRLHLYRAAVPVPLA